MLLVRAALQILRPGLQFHVILNILTKTNVQKELLKHLFNLIHADFSIDIFIDFSAQI